MIDQSQTHELKHDELNTVRCRAGQARFTVEKLLRLRVANLELKCQLLEKFWRKEMLSVTVLESRLEEAKEEIEKLKAR